MVRLNRIYTGGGDRGETSLGGGARVRKSSPRIAAIGAVDEANAAIGLARAETLSAEADAMLARVQNELLDLGADLARPTDREQAETLRVTEAQVTALERDIDAVNAGLGPLDSFVLPGGTRAAAALHLARTVARRAEGLAWSLAETEQVESAVLVYLNRLSDLLFVLAREANDGGRADVLWRPGASRGGR